MHPRLTSSRTCSCRWSTRIGWQRSRLKKKLWFQLVRTTLKISQPGRSSIYSTRKFPNVDKAKLHMLMRSGFWSKWEPKGSHISKILQKYQQIWYIYYTYNAITGRTLRRSKNVKWLEKKIEHYITIIHTAWRYLDRIEQLLGGLKTNLAGFWSQNSEPCHGLQPLVGDWFHILI